MAWRLATCPTNRSPVLVNATTDGVVRPPSSLGITLGSPPSITATQELVVPRSIPIIFAINLLLGYKCCSSYELWAMSYGALYCLLAARCSWLTAPISALDSVSHLCALSYYES